MAIGGDDPFTEVTRMEASRVSAASNFCVSQPVDAGCVFHRLWPTVTGTSGRPTDTRSGARISARRSADPAATRRTGSACQPASPIGAPGSQARPDSCCFRTRTFARSGATAATSPGDVSCGDSRIARPHTDTAAESTQSRTPAGASGSCVTCSSADPNTSAFSPPARSAIPSATAVPTQPALSVTQPVAAADSLSRIWRRHSRLWHPRRRHSLSPPHHFLSHGQRTVLSGRHRHRSRSTADSHSRTTRDY